MNRRIIVSVLVCGLSAWLTGASVVAEVRLPHALGSHMVLQRDAPITIWGWAAPDEAVSVSMGELVQQTKADNDGAWSVQLPAQSADSDGRTITIAGTNTIELTDVLFGDVWLGSGQSNMEWQLQRSQNPETSIAAADHPLLRLFHVPKVKAARPQPDLNATWHVCTPETVPAFSAVLYYFGLKLHQETDVPMGLINTSWGGSPIEPWTVTDSGSGEMYNAMVAPLTKLSVRGTVWYQGETNILQKNGFAYAQKMTDLITGWRQAFDHDSLPFYYVQIAPWSGRYEPGQLPAVWEAQTATLNLPHTGMAVTTDLVDDISDIHPRNKQDVGHRLARWALVNDYGQQDLIYSGPIYRSVSFDGDAATIRFHFTGEGLTTRDGQPPNEFQIAGADGEFHPATASISGDTVVVRSDQVSEPTQVQFGWHKLTNPNLVNSAGLPASPFRTHEWRGFIDVSH